MLDIKDGSTGKTNGGSGLDGRSTGEGNATEVGKGDEGVALLVILNNPLGIVLAEVCPNITGESVGNGGTLGNVLNDGGSGSFGGGGNGDLDGVTSRDGDTGEVIGVGWVPLIPSLVGVGRSRSGPVDTSLENSSAASVTVNTNPCGTGTGSRWGWDNEGTSYGSETSADEDGTSPVVGILDIGFVGDFGRWALNIPDWVSVVATVGALGSTCLSQSSSWGSDGRAGENGGSGDSGELHVD